MMTKINKEATIVFILSFLWIGLYGQSVYEDNASDKLDKATSILYTNPDQSSFYSKQAIELSKKSKDKDLTVESMITLSLAERLLGNFDSSIQTLFEALNIVSSNESLRGEVLLSIGEVYSRLSDYKKAIEYNDKATSIFKSIGDSAKIALCYNSRGLVHYNLEEYLIAEQFFLQSLNINRSLKLMKEIAGNLNNLCLYKGDFDEKYQYINEAIIINKHLDAQWALAENYNNLGKQFYYAGKYIESMDALNISYKIADKIGAKELLCDNYEYSSWVFEAKGDYKSAFNSLKQLSYLSGLLQQSSNLRNIEESISNKRITEQKIITEQSEHEFRIKLLKRNIFLLVSLILLILFVVLFFSKKYKKQKQIELANTKYKLEHSERENTELKLKQQELELGRVQEVLELKRQEITEFAMFIQSQNELLESISDKLKKGYSMSESKLKDYLRQINLFILQYQDSNKSRNKLLSTIENENHEFITRLLAKHNNLTRGERELASLLRINLTSKDISIITGRSEKTVNMSRYRLRKALNISSEDNLNEYLQNI